MRPPTAMVAQVLAAFGVDPAYASWANFLVLIYIVTLNRKVADQAAELARTAKGSEDRATAAAARIDATATKIDGVAAEVVVLARAIKDEMRRFHGEWARLDEAQREMGLAILRERPLVGGQPVVTPSPGGMP